MRTRLPFLLAAIAAVVLALAAVASAQSGYSWSGATSLGPGAYAWSTATNWVGGTSPSGAVGTLTFPALTSSNCASLPYSNACYDSDNDLTGVSAAGLALDDGVPYNIYGNSITLGGNGLTAAPSANDTGAGVPALDLPITLGAPQAWSIIGGSYTAGLQIGKTVTGSGSALGIAFTAGTSPTPPYVAFDADAEIGNVTVTGPGSILLTTAQSSLDGTDGHTVNFSGGANLQANPGTTGPLTMGGGQITVGGAGQSNNTLSISGSLTLNATSTLSMYINNSTPSGAGTGYSQLRATGNVSLGSATLTLTGYGAGNTCPSYAPGDVDTLLTTSGTLSGTFGGVPNGGTVSVLCPSGAFPSFRINYTPTTVVATALASTTTALAATPPSSVTNQRVTLTATVSPHSVTPTGTVSFDDFGAPIAGCGSVPVTLNATSSAYTAVCRTSFDASTSPEALTATFTPSSSSDVAGSATTSLSTLVVGPDNTTTTLSTSSAAPAPGQSVTYTATVIHAHSGPIEASGTVEFFDGGSPISACTNQPLTTGTAYSLATCTLSYPSAGAHSITAQYLPDTASFNGSASVPLGVDVRGPTTPPGKPVNTLAPAVATERSGPLYVGRFVGTSTGTWSGSAPITYGYQWVRCKPGCVAIAGATDSTYNVVSADVGARLLVVVTAQNGLGTAHATSNSVGPVVPSVQEVVSALSRVFVVRGPGARIAALLAHGGFTYTFVAPGAGSLTVRWSYGRGARTVAIAIGGARVAGGPAKVKVRLTKAGRRMLERAKTLKMTAQATFKPVGAPAVSAANGFRVSR